MNITIAQPKVYLVTRPSVDWDQVAVFLADEGVPGIPESIRAGKDESAAVAEISARLCYMSYGRGRRDIADFINNLLRAKDGSVFEHINYGFVFTGVSRSLTHELVRHRAGFAYSQRSQRYVDESGGRFVAPPALSDALSSMSPAPAKAGGTGDSDDDEACPELAEGRAEFEAALENAAESYRALVRALQTAIPREKFEYATDHRKAVRQAARAVLPNATETKIFVTANVRAWRHFIEMRASPFADVEIRRLAIMVLEALQAEAPLLFGDFTIEIRPDGSKIATPKYSKV